MQSPTKPQPSVSPALLVESETNMRSALAGFFGELGYQVLSAAGADEARRLAQENPSLQLAFLNLTDPQSGDLELAAWLRSFCPATKVILATPRLGQNERSQ